MDIGPRAKKVAIGYGQNNQVLEVRELKLKKRFLNLISQTSNILMSFSYLWTFENY